MEQKRKIILEKYPLISWILASILALLIFIMSSLSLKGGTGTRFLPIFYHFIVFFWLSFFLAISFTKGKRVILIIPSLFISLFYALSDEFHQLFVPYRACSFEDFLIDSAGILFASLIYLITIKIRKNKITSSELFSESYLQPGQ
ncbi:MAG: VanZ family protein [Nanoarchaeota archaeon]|nr:VanZ family protein [Nanoarchaeota archaeon]